MGKKINPKNNLNSIKLSNEIDIEKYQKLVEEKNKKEIARFIYKRFSERYIAPLENSPKKNGFCTMANCCLMIEALESFYNGWKDTKNRRDLAFCKFFDRVKEFWDFHGHSSEFYRNVRCGILHQAETTGGWRIKRKGSLFSPDSLTINATRFLGQLKKYLEGYRRDLENADWNNKIWKNLRKKMDTIIYNCKREVT
ncbi:MAG: hypothetical protein KKA79_09930 [Nanoarchaeota archaeon]|nr:hypothetical protein [Nanoarchaeota archaeon]